MKGSNMISKHSDRNQFRPHTATATGLKRLTFASPWIESMPTVDGIEVTSVAGITFSNSFEYAANVRTA